MKRYSGLLLVLLLAFGAAACAEVSFTAGEPHTSLDFRLYFETMSATEGACTVSIQKDAYDDVQAKMLWNIIMADLRALSSVTGIAPDAMEPLTVFVVERAPEGVQRYGSRLYCTAEDVENGAYCTALISATLGVEEYWKALGLESYLRDEQADNALLRAAYEQADDLDSLSLFIAYFTSPFASEEEVALAWQTAMAVSRYIIERYGIKALLEEDCIAYKQEWLHTLGIDRAYDDPLYHPLRDYRFTASGQYPLIAATPGEHVFYIQPLQDLQTAADVRRFLYDAAVGAEEVLALIAEQAPEYAEAVKRRWDAKLDVYCGEGNGSFAVPSQRKIQLQLSYGYLHELGHILIPTRTDAGPFSPTWQYEGLCEYFSYAVHPARSLMDSYYYDILRLYGETGAAEGEGKSPNADNRQFWSHVTELYLSGAAMPGTADELDMTRFVSAMAQAPLRYRETLKDSVWSIPINGQYSRVEGNELTYAQAFCFAADLIERYSLRTYLAYCLEDQTFDEVFGMSYAEAKEIWRLAWMEDRAR